MITGPRGCGKTTKLVDHLITAVSFLPEGEQAMVITPKMEVTRDVLNRAGAIHFHQGDRLEQYHRWCQLAKRKILAESFNTIDNAGRGHVVTNIFIDEMSFLRKERYDVLIRTQLYLREIYLTI